jgi:hypothetical protein
MGGTPVVHRVAPSTAQRQIALNEDVMQARGSARSVSGPVGCLQNALPPFAVGF